MKKGKLTFQKLRKMIKSIKDSDLILDSTWIIDGKVLSGIELEEYIKLKYQLNKTIDKIE